MSNPQIDAYAKHGDDVPRRAKFKVGDKIKGDHPRGYEGIVLAVDGDNIRVRMPPGETTCFAHELVHHEPGPPPKSMTSERLGEIEAYGKDLFGKGPARSTGDCEDELEIAVKYQVELATALREAWGELEDVEQLVQRLRGIRIEQRAPCEQDLINWYAARLRRGRGEPEKVPAGKHCPNCVVYGEDSHADHYRVEP